MRAVVQERYGPPDLLDVREIDKPSIPADSVLVRVQAASVNPLDWHSVTGTPFLVRVQGGLRKPKSHEVGVDFAGTVEEAGSSVTQFRPGDEVFGARSGAFAEYVCVREERGIVPKPANLSFEQAAAVPVAAITALQGLRDKGNIQAGQQVLINGASGGVGTFAVQLAKAFGAEVTGVCSSRNVEVVRALGADHVVDYTREDFTRGDRRYDLALDVAGGRSWPDWKRVLAPDATVVVVGGPKINRLTGISLRSLLWARFGGLFRSQKVVFFLAKITKQDLLVLQELLEAGKVAPVIDRSYELSDVAESLRYLGEGHAKGKIILTV